MFEISNEIMIPDEEIELSAIRAQGAGGQNVNKVSSAIHLRFDIAASSLPEVYKQRLLTMKDRRISSDGVLIIKAQRFRKQEKNRADALERLRELIAGTLVERKVRRPTRPSAGAKRRRKKEKSRRAKLKSLRGRVTDE